MSGIDPVQSAVLAELVRAPAAAAGYRLVEISGGRAVELLLEKGGARFALWLRPLSAESHSYKQTARFKLGYSDAPPDRLGYTLLDGFCARVAAWEASLSEAELERLFAVADDTTPDAAGDAYERLGIDLERLAVEGGVKPVCRAVGSATQVDAQAAAARAAGLCVERTEAPAFVGGFCETEAHRARDAATTLLYVARDAARAAAAAAAERAMVETCARGAVVSDEQVRRLGAALGYPSCCVEAFLPLRDRPNAAIRFAALRRTPGAGCALVNDAVGGRSLVSHAPCRYDCAPSRTYAAALLDHLAAVDRGAAAALVDSLRGVMVLFRAGGALRLTAAAPRDDGVVGFSAVEVCSPGPSVEAWCAALAGGEALALGADAVTVLRDGRAAARLGAPADAVQVRRFE